LSLIVSSVAYTFEEIRKKSWNEPKTVVTLHRQSDRTTILRQKNRRTKKYVLMYLCQKKKKKKKEK